MIKSIFAAICLTCSCLVLAVDIKDLNPIETLSVEYPAFKEPMQLNVTLPASYSSEKDKRYFVIFDLHPRSQTYLSGLHDWLSHNGEWPWLETIIVTPANYHKEFAKLFEETVANPDDPRLLDVVEKKILQKIDQSYRTNGFKIYSGFMSNGAIGLYAMLNRPQLFNAYMISSPTLSDNFLSINSSAKDKLPALTGKKRFLYLSIGEHAYENSHIEGVKSFAQSLKTAAPEALNWQLNTDDKHYYMSRPIFTVLNGIEKLFDDYHNELAADSAISKQGAESIIKYYAALSEKKYGFTISAEGSLKNLADSLLETAPEQALKIYQQTIDLYPDSAYAYSAYAYSALAAAYSKTGKLKRAIDTQTIAVEKSANMIEFHQNKLNEQLLEYKGKFEKP